LEDRSTSVVEFHFEFHLAGKIGQWTQSDEARRQTLFLQAAEPEAIRHWRKRSENLGKILSKTATLSAIVAKRMNSTQESPSSTIVIEPIQFLDGVVLINVLVRVIPSTGGAEPATRDVLKRVQDERVCWSTTDEGVDRSADSILRVGA
jgi:hypothetical protein